MSCTYPPDLLLQGLQRFGMDFGAMESLFSGRSRLQLKNKYKRELRQRPFMVRRALSTPISDDHPCFKEENQGKFKVEGDEDEEKRKEGKYEDGGEGKGCLKEQKGSKAADLKGKPNAKVKPKVKAKPKAKAVLKGVKKESAKKGIGTGVQRGDDEDGMKGKGKKGKGKGRGTKKRKNDNGNHEESDGQGEESDDSEDDEEFLEDEVDGLHPPPPRQGRAMRKRSRSTATGRQTTEPANTRSRAK
ncbi:unnamed protein product, partial [Choristocarpus tenellus]